MYNSVKLCLCTYTVYSGKGTYKKTYKYNSITYNNINYSTILPINKSVVVSSMVYLQCCYKSDINNSQ